MATQAGELPDDALAGVFHGLPPRSLAVARCVCKAWRDIVDGRALLLRHLHLLPLTVRGVFANIQDDPHPYHLARPLSSTSASRIPNADGTLSFLPGNGDRCRWVSVLDHCSGLLLCGESETELGGELCVCNPATRRWTVLPRWWADGDRRRYDGAYLAFDPAESSEYQVILVPAVPEDAPPHLQPEWPPAAWTLRVFSSSTGQWEDRDFVREGLPAGTLEKVRLDPELRSHWRYAVYHHGSLYVHCRGSFVTRFSLSKSTYQVIETPTNVNEYTKPYLGKLHYGVCFGIVHDHQLKVWILNEACGQMRWVMKSETMVGHYPGYLASTFLDCHGRRHNGSWTVEKKIEIQDAYPHVVVYILEEESIETQDIDHDVEYLSEEESAETQDIDHDIESLSEEENIEIQDIDHDIESLSEEENIEIQDIDHDIESQSKEENIEFQDIDHYVESLSKAGHEWDSDNDDTFTINTESQAYFDDGELNIIGFHPYKEVVFMAQRLQVVAYHLNSTKIQYLGNLRPEVCYNFWDSIQSFLYTPCMIGDLLHGDQTGGSSSIED